MSRLYTWPQYIHSAKVYYTITFTANSMHTLIMTGRSCPIATMCHTINVFVMYRTSFKCFSICQGRILKVFRQISIEFSAKKKRNCLNDQNLSFSYSKHIKIKLQYFCHPLENLQKKNLFISSDLMKMMHIP